jgi:mono/diheme cytochrome c family protein
VNPTSIIDGSTGRHRRRASTAILAWITLLLLVAALGARADDPKTARTWKAKCGSCHGADGKGDTEQGRKAKVANFSSPEWQKSKSDADIKSAIENGKKKGDVEMEPYKDKLEPAQIDTLVGYIRTLK